MSIKISELDSATTIQGIEELPVVQSAATKKATVSDVVRKPVIQWDLEVDNLTITSYGFYYITKGTNVGDPYGIILPDPSANAGMEITIFNYDQTTNAEFGGTYLPINESSSNPADKYNYVPARQTVLLVAINGYWSANSYKF
jgi:hypothetical protein